ncbi:MAG: hypothetical protein J6Z31_00165 [Fibrobacter sp.]|nr:hypothetical protein [Fibrobacter sp.]
MKKIFALICLFSALAFAGASEWEKAPTFAVPQETTLDPQESSSEEAPAVESSAPEVSTVEVSTVKASAPKVEKVRIAHPKEHRGFYSNFSMGFSYANFHVENEDDKDYEEASFQGYTFPLMDFRFGVAVANLLAFYTEFNFAFYMGDADDVSLYCDSYGDCDVDKGSDDNSIMARSYVGFGMSIYPFRDTSSVLNGFFLGGSIGYGAEVVYGADLEEIAGEANLDWGFTVEIGKDWWVNDHLSIGLSAAYFHASPKLNVTGDDNGINGFHILFRLTRG